jgi:WD40 repeat protein
MIDAAAKAKELKLKYEGWQLEKSIHTGIQLEKRILDIDCDEMGNIYITTIWDGTVHVFSAEGREIKTFCEAEGAPFQRAEFIKVNREKDELYVSDTHNNRLIAFNIGDGTVARSYTFDTVAAQGQGHVIQAFDWDDESNLWVAANVSGGIKIYKLDKDFQLLQTLHFAAINSVRINSLSAYQNKLLLLVNSFKQDGKITLYTITGDHIEPILQETKLLLFFFAEYREYLYLSVALDEISHYDFFKVHRDGTIVYKYKCDGEKIKSPAGICYHNDRLYLAGMDDGIVRVLKRRI